MEVGYREEPFSQAAIACVWEKQVKILEAGHMMLQLRDTYVGVSRLRVQFVPIDEIFHAACKSFDVCAATLRIACQESIVRLDQLGIVGGNERYAPQEDGKPNLVQIMAGLHHAEDFPWLEEFHDELENVEIQSGVLRRLGPSLTPELHYMMSPLLVQISRRDMLCTLVFAARRARHTARGGPAVSCCSGARNLSIPVARR